MGNTKKAAAKVVPFDVLQKRKACGIRRGALCAMLNVSPHLMTQYEKQKALPEPVYDTLKQKVPQWFHMEMESE